MPRRPWIAAVTAAALLLTHAAISAQTVVPTVPPPNAQLVVPTALPGIRLEIVGPITAFDGQRVVVAGLIFDITRAELSLPLAVGTVVKVEAALVNGIWLAREVEAPNADDRDDGLVAPVMTPEVGLPIATATLVPTGTPFPAVNREIELYGLVTAIEPGFITIGGQRVDVRRAEIEGGIVIGLIVEAYVTGRPGAYVAREVDLVRDDDLTLAERQAVQAGGLIIDDRDDDSNQSNNTSSNQSNNTSSNQSNNTSSNQSNNTSSNQSNNTSSNQSNNTSSNQSNNQSDDSSSNQSSNQSDDSSSNQSSNQSDNSSSNQSSNQSDDNSGSGGGDDSGGSDHDDDNDDDGGDD